MTTDILRCSITELVAIDRAVKGPYQRELLMGRTPWGGNAARRASQHSFLERLRDVRGLLVIEDPIAKHVVICGSLTLDGFRKKI